MARYRGPVEQARRDLRERGSTVAQARRLAPAVADARQAALDQVTVPFPWLGGPAVGVWLQDAICAEQTRRLGAETDSDGRA